MLVRRRRLSTLLPNCITSIIASLTRQHLFLVLGWVQRCCGAGAEELGAENVGTSPDGQAPSSEDDAPSYVLLAFDGTWPQAREMFRVRSRTAPCLALNNHRILTRLAHWQHLRRCTLSDHRGHTCSPTRRLCCRRRARDSS